jgi:two-component system response regulator RegA
MGDKKNMGHGAGRPGPNVKERRLLILDDDEPLRLRLATAMEKRGFAVSLAESVGEALKIASSQVHDYALLDLRLEDGSGLEVVTALHDSNPDIKIVMLTGFGNIATAVSAVKAGAIDYLPKPADADVIEKTLLADSDSLPPPPDQPMSANRVRWEHILRVFEQCGRNVSETARRLNMHRRTLQRILNKHAPK